MKKKFLIKFGVCQKFWKPDIPSRHNSEFNTTKTHLYSTLQLNLSSDISKFTVSDQLGYGHGRYLVYWDISAFAEEEERLFISSEQFFLAAKTSHVLLQCQYRKMFSVHESCLLSCSKPNSGANPCTHYHPDSGREENRLLWHFLSYIWSKRGEILLFTLCIFDLFISVSWLLTQSLFGNCIVMLYCSVDRISTCSQ